MAFAALAAAVALAAAAPSSQAKPHPYDASPRWSPDSRRIAFLRDERLMTMSAAGRSLRAYRCGGSDVWADATTVVCEARGDLALADVRTGRVRTLDSGRGGAVAQEEVSPDGRRIAFARYPPRGTRKAPPPPSIWTIRTR